MKMNRSASFTEDRKSKLKKIKEKEKTIFNNKLNLSTSNKNSFNNSYISRLEAIKSNFETKQEVLSNIILNY